MEYYYKKVGKMVVNHSRCKYKLMSAVVNTIDLTCMIQYILYTFRYSPIRLQYTTRATLLWHTKQQRTHIHTKKYNKQQHTTKTHGMQKQRQA